VILFVIQYSQTRAVRHILVLMADDLAVLERTAPSIATALHRFVATYMSERLAKITATVQALH